MPTLNQGSFVKNTPKALVRSVKNVDVYVDQQLTWKELLNKISLKIAGNVGLITVLWSLTYCMSMFLLICSTRLSLTVTWFGLEIIIQGWFRFPSILRNLMMFPVVINCFNNCRQFAHHTWSKGDPKFARLRSLWGSALVRTIWCLLIMYNCLIFCTMVWTRAIIVMVNCTTALYIVLIKFGVV